MHEIENLEKIDMFNRQKEYKKILDTQVYERNNLNYNIKIKEDLTIPTEHQHDLLSYEVRY